ncbi:hypothetical protein GCM10009827_028200 [Dactylosporangium maewongense]|uniref:Uncharacterized protein n=1 Tax=Dactylosporangium maewongense TaxID=634393 RepID=A0ABN2A684_9ACTN
MQPERHRARRLLLGEEIPGDARLRVAPHLDHEVRLGVVTCHDLGDKGQLPGLQHLLVIVSRVRHDHIGDDDPAGSQPDVHSLQREQAGCLGRTVERARQQ